MERKGLSDERSGSAGLMIESLIDSSIQLVKKKKAVEEDEKSKEFQILQGFHGKPHVTVCCFEDLGCG